MSDYCTHCHKVVAGRWQDEGLGEVEFWGVKSQDSAWAYVCPECEEPLETEYSGPDDEADEAMADWRREEAKYEKLGI